MNSPATATTLLSDYAAKAKTPLEICVTAHALFLCFNTFRWTSVIITVTFNLVLMILSFPSPVALGNGKERTLGTRLRDVKNVPLESRCIAFTLLYTPGKLLVIHEMLAKLKHRQ